MSDPLDDLDDILSSPQSRPRTSYLAPAGEPRPVTAGPPRPRQDLTGWGDAPPPGSPAPPPGPPAGRRQRAEFQETVDTRGGVTLPESDSGRNVAAMSDRTEAVERTQPKPSLETPRTTTASSTPGCTQAERRTLDSLPLEMLLEIVSRLDWRALRSLFLTSRRCRDAVASHLSRLRVFRIRDSDLEDVVKTSADLTLLLAQMTSLRELHLETLEYRVSRDVPEALVSCLRSWPVLEILNLRLREYSTELLERFCAGCKTLNEVTLGDRVGDEAVEAVLAGRPDLLALDVSNGPLRDTFDTTSLRGDFFERLPAKLCRLAVKCNDLRSSAVTKLARCSELRSLELNGAFRLRQKDLATGLTGCAQLERLVLGNLNGPFIDCVPSAGLHELRCLELSYCHLPDSNLRQLVLRLPNLQSVCLMYCDGPSRRGLGLLGRLPALTSLGLFTTEGITDWALAQLSSAPLTELRVGEESDEFAASVTAEGLLRLTQTCPSLRKITLWYDDWSMESAKCGPDTDEKCLLEWLRERLRYFK